MCRGLARLCRGSGSPGETCSSIATRSVSSQPRWGDQGRRKIRLVLASAGPLLYMLPALIGEDALESDTRVTLGSSITCLLFILRPR